MIDLLIKCYKFSVLNIRIVFIKVSGSVSGNCNMVCLMFKV